MHSQGQMEKVNEKRIKAPYFAEFHELLTAMI